ncbi:MAG: GNAT family N-acetyltransferase [Oscillospiraceae bacterium]|jgi:GNAT superfamily N-acetyltransferase|nr:GNAT family N-acetyltransferase [Oscillospiraceae bacterium]
MIITLKRINMFSKDYRNIGRLYRTAFPADERAPMWLLAMKSGKENVDFWGIYADGKWSGLAYVISEGSASYLFYLALSENMRGRGIGSKALQSILIHYEGQRIFLALEQLDESANNFEERQKRRKFYIRNGLRPLPLTIREATVTYDVMGTGLVKPEEYESMMKKYLGAASRLVSMNITE